MPQTLMRLSFVLYSGKDVSQFSAKCQSALALVIEVLVVFNGSWSANVPAVELLF